MNSLKNKNVIRILIHSNFDETICTSLVEADKYRNPWKWKNWKKICNYNFDEHFKKNKCNYHFDENVEKNVIRMLMKMLKKKM